MLHVFFGHEDRANVGTTVFVHSAIQHARKPLALCPITRAMADAPEGSNAFTARRFLVPWAMGWRGWAVFVDGADMICRADLNELLDLRDYYKAVQVVKHDYATKHARKYVGAPMEADNPDYERKQWASVMLINCGHFAWRQFTPEHIQRTPMLDLLQLKGIPDDRIGELPAAWNWLADEQGDNPNAKLLHFTAGIPAFEAYAGSPMASEWHVSARRAMTATG